jgi:serine/threonine-protein kinase
MPRAAMSDEDPRVGRLIDDRYRLEARLAAGGMGVVYRAARIGIGKPVAVKFLLEQYARVADLVKRFEREAAAMSRLAHPHLISVIDYGVALGSPYLVMEFETGQLLGDLLTHGALPPARAVGIIRQVLSGVRHAHASGVVHRDIKPDNVMLIAGVERDFVKILDFGLAKILAGDGVDATQLTQTGFALGTPGYMSPEQAQGDKIDLRTDLYAVGVVLYEMVVGHQPFLAKSPQELLRKHMDEKPTPPRKAGAEQASPELEQVILRALEKLPARRWQTAAEFAAALEATPEAQPSDVVVVRTEGEERTDSELALARTMTPLEAAAQRELSRAVTRTAVDPPRGSLLRRISIGVGVGAFIGAALLMWAHERARRRVLARMVQAPPAAALAPPAVHAHAPPAVTPAAAPAQTPAGAGTTDTGEDPAAATRGTEADGEDNGTGEGDEAAPPPEDTPGRALERDHTMPPERIPSVHALARMVAAGKVDQAIPLLYAARELSPHEARVPLLLGHAYFRKVWRTDGLREYRAALTLEPALRDDAVLMHNAVVALEDPTYRPARALLHKHPSRAAVHALREAARSAKNPQLARRAAKLLDSLAPHGHVR